MRAPLLILLLFAIGCQRVPTQIQPCVETPPHPKEIFRETRGVAVPQSRSYNPFPALTAEERATDWGKEHEIALAFAADFDLFRAITSFKRALFLLPPECRERRLELEYDVALSYYLGKKYIETVYTVESTELLAIDATFPAYRDMLLMLYDSYTQLERCDNAAHILGLIERDFPEIAMKLALLRAVECGDLCFLSEVGKKNSSCGYLSTIVEGYECNAKSIPRAQLLNALVPGAGYWYVGQRETAVTALLINALFITASVQCFCHDQLAAGIILASIESGWYFGGIQGAGLAAKRYNEDLYERYAAKITQREGFCPALMLRFSF